MAKPISTTKPFKKTTHSTLDRVRIGACHLVGVPVSNISYDEEHHFCRDHNQGSSLTNNLHEFVGQIRSGLGHASLKGFPVRWPCCLKTWLH
jgi:hypothetical protein